MLANSAAVVDMNLMKCKAHTKAARLFICDLIECEFSNSIIFKKNTNYNLVDTFSSNENWGHTNQNSSALCR